MSRCFPFPTPGYKRKTRADDADLLKKGPFGMSHQQALAQVTGQAQANMHMQGGFQTSLAVAASGSEPFPAFTSGLSMQLNISTSASDTIETKEPSQISGSDQRSQIVVDKPADDGYNWRKYGQKPIKGSEFPQSYYKCTHAGCPTRKKVERSCDGQVTEIIYKGQHNHQQPQKWSKDGGNLSENLGTQANTESHLQPQVSNMNNMNEGNQGMTLQSDVDEPDAKRRNTEVQVTEQTTSHSTVTEPRIIVQTTSEVDLLDDGYRWHKYGQEVVKGNPHPRSSKMQSKIMCNGCRTLLSYPTGASNVQCAVCNAVTPVQYSEHPPPAAVTNPLAPGALLKDKGLAKDLNPFSKVGIRTAEQLIKEQDAVEKETLLGKLKNKKNSNWRSLAQALRAIMNLRILNGQKLYCCLFPSDYEFERETLVQLWMGLFQPPCENYAEGLFNRLLNGNYIYKSRADILTGRNKYKIDADKVTSHFSMVKNRDHYTMIGDENIGVDISKAWHVSVASKSVDETVFKTLEGSSGLRSVLFIHDYGSSLKRIPSTFFTTLPHMQVLDLSGSHISELHSSIGNMTRLYFLDLSCTLIERIPESIRLLQELQTLKLRGCKHLHKLPKGMKELVNLYHFDFDVLGQLTSMPKGLGSLIRLRMLSAFIVSEEDGCSLRELKDMNNLRGSLCISGLEYATGEDAMTAAMQNKILLTRLHFKWNDSKFYNDNDRNRAYSTLQSLCPHYSSLVELQISYYPGYTLPTWIQHPELMHLVSITFLRCENETLIVRECLPNLRHLNIYEMNRVRYIGSKSHLNVARFPKLETVTIDGMLNLQGLTEVQVGDYPCLSKVSMKRCPKLTELPVLPFLGSLTYLEISHCKSIKSLPEGKLPTLLETLMIDNCPLLKPRCSKDGEDWENIKHVPNIWIDMKDIRHEDTDSLSEEEYESFDDSD